MSEIKPLKSEQYQEKPGGLFKEGNPGGGRPKGSGLNLTSLLKQHLEKKPKGKKEYYKDLFIKTLLHKALIEKDIQALKLIMNYVDGLPKQDIGIIGDLKIQFDETFNTTPKTKGNNTE